MIDSSVSQVKENLKKNLIVVVEFQEKAGNFRSLVTRRLARICKTKRQRKNDLWKCLSETILHFSQFCRSAKVYQ